MNIGDPDAPLLQTSVLCFAAGVGWALLAVLAIWLGSTRLSPRVPQGQVWALWRRRRTLWFLAILMGGIAAWLTADQVIQRIALRELFWISRPGIVLSAGRLGAGTGYLLVLGIATLVPAVRRAREAKGRGRD